MLTCNIWLIADHSFLDILEKVIVLGLFIGSISRNEGIVWPVQEDLKIRICDRFDAFLRLFDLRQVQCSLASVV